MRFLANESLEDYLTTIYRMQNSGEVRSKQLVEYLQVSKSSVSEMLNKLSNLKLVTHSRYSLVKLTKKGELIAKKIVFKHRVIEMFLVKMLKQNRKSVHEEAHKLEHAFSDESIKRIYTLIGRPTIGAHGENIPIVKL